MINTVDGFLNHVSMYRLVLYYVAGLLAVAFIAGFFALVPVDPAALAFSTVFITAMCWLVNRAITSALRIPANSESVYITALILALIMPPVLATDTTGMMGMGLASVVAIVSKFILAPYRRHVFNPVALGVAVSAVAMDQPATWWACGNMYLMPMTLIGGLLILRKVQRFDMFTVYLAANVVVTALSADADTRLDALQMSLLSSPLLFAGFAMLTEPLTAPAAFYPRLVYGAIVGALSVPLMHVGETYFTPELALLVGNAFTWIASPKHRYKLTLEKIEKQASGCYDYVFRSNRKVAHAAGQYMDWTAHVRSADNRGNRRAFTVASAPGSDVVRLGVKFYSNGSAFKQSMLAMTPGDVVYASHVAGDFTLPRDATLKLAFLAGGIGVTPFRSMVEEMLVKQDRRDAVLFYGNNSSNEIAYADVFRKAEDELGLRTVYAVVAGAERDTNMHHGFIDADLIKQHMPDFHERVYYLSGPRSMVTRFQQVLADMGIARSKIKMDYFPGFA
jgi:glycine betaine catabolism B